MPWLLGVLADHGRAARSSRWPPTARWSSAGSAATRHRAARDPYFLFAASNGGSLLGLLAYPLVRRAAARPRGPGPRRGRSSTRSPSRSWPASAVALWLRPAAAARAARRAAGGRRGAARLARRRLRWVALAAVPSSLMLGATTYLTRDLSPGPAAVGRCRSRSTCSRSSSPSRRGPTPARLTVLGRRAWPLAAILLTYTLVVGTQEPLGGLLVAAPRRADRRRPAAATAAWPPTGPTPRHLTEFYLWVAVGGALGGAFNALLAPLVFPGLIEYPLAIVAVCLLRPAPPKKRPELLEFFLRDERPTRWMDAIVPVLLGRRRRARARRSPREPEGGVPTEIRAAGGRHGVRPGRQPRAPPAALRPRARRRSSWPPTRGRRRRATSCSSATATSSASRRVVATDDGRAARAAVGQHAARRRSGSAPGPPEPLSYYGAREPGRAGVRRPAARRRRATSRRSASAPARWPATRAPAAASPSSSSTRP